MIDVGQYAKIPDVLHDQILPFSFIANECLGA